MKAITQAEINAIVAEHNPAALRAHRVRVFTAAVAVAAGILAALVAAL